MKAAKEEKTRKASQKKRDARSALDWQCARVFLEVARNKSFRGAATILGVSVNAVRRKTELLEQQLRITLFTRHIDGVRLTREGQRVLQIVQRMEADAFRVMRVAAAVDSGMEGTVRLAVTEGLGSFWIAPRLIDFAQQCPNILVDMQCTMAPADVLRLEADVSVQLKRPSSSDIRVVKIGRLHLMLFAAASLASQERVPQSYADLARHRFVVQASEQLVSMEDYAKQLGDFSHIVPAMRSNVSSSHYFGIATGLGIGLLPTYCSALGAKVIPLDLPFRAYQDIWLAYHADAAKISRVRKLIDWLIESFSPQRYPWFADDRMHPKDFPKNLPGMPDLKTFYPFTLNSDV